MVIVITGPTGVGKTKLSIELAKKMNGEIINADSTQIFKGLDIATAKVTNEEKENIIHNLIDIKEISEDYTVYDYQKDARKKIDEIIKKNKTPIIVGGTGLYIKAALYDYKFNEEKNKMFRNSLDKLLPQKLIPVVIKRSGIDPNKKVNEITKKEREKLVLEMKEFKILIKEFRPIEEAIVTSGGINIKEINPKTMESKKIKGLYFAGEIIDVDSYTGGFNLQIAYSTGYVAGLN